MNGRTVTLNTQGKVDGSVEAFDVNGMMAIPQEDGVVYVRWSDVQAFFPQAQEVPSEPVATKQVSDPLDPDDGPFFAHADIARLKALPNGTKLFAGKPGTKATFQERTSQWVNECFGPEVANDMKRRLLAYLEESLELVQSFGFKHSEALTVADYVFSRPAGDPPQEVGGVRLTLSGLCQAAGLDENSCAEAELARVWTKIPKIQAKQAAKPDFALASPASARPAPVSDQDAFEHTLSEHAIASNYQGDGVYGAPARRLREFFQSGVEHGRQQRGESNGR